MSVTDELVEKLRSVSYSLRPPAFDLMGLNSALSALCREVEHQSKIHIFYQSGALPDLQDEAGISIYRFVHEALANIVKHSHATQASVSADYADEKISVHVSDNGVGFDARTFKKGIGIDSVTDRFNLLGGVFSMDSAPGLGVQLRVELPWKVDAGFFD